jgi:hypothetical protein
LAWQHNRQAKEDAAIFTHTGITYYPEENIMSSIKTLQLQLTELTSTVAELDEHQTTLATLSSFNPAILCEPSGFNPAILCEPSGFNPAILCEPSTFNPAILCEPSGFNPAILCEPSTFNPAV